MHTNRQTDNEAADVSLVTVGLIDFATPTLLMLGSARSLEMLSALMRKSADFDFAAHPDLIALVNIGVSVNNSMGMSSIILGEGNVQLQLTEPDRIKFADQIMGVAKSDHPSHTYLDGTFPPDVPIETKVSKDEYDPRILFSKRG